MQEKIIEERIAELDPNKKVENGKDIIYINQDMTELDLFGTVDVAVSALDSLNHITDYDDFCKALKKVSLFLHPDGVFIFDVNTVFKHREILADNTFVYDYGNVYCVWQNTLSENNVVSMELDIFVSENGEEFERLGDSFSERAYTDEEIKNALKEAGLSVCAVYGEDSFESPKENEQRLIYVAKHSCL